MYNNQDYLAHYGVQGMRWGIRSAQRQLRGYQAQADFARRKGKLALRKANSDAKYYSTKAKNTEIAIKKGEKQIQDYESLDKKGKAKVQLVNFVGGSKAAQLYTKALKNEGNKKVSDAYKKKATNMAIFANVVSIAGAVSIVALTNAMAKHF